MNQQWFDKMKGRILRMRYRQKGHKNEFPTDYFYCKWRAIEEVFTLTPSETIMEIMNGAPHYWKVLIDTARITTVLELQDLLKFHKDNLMKDPNAHQYDLERRIKVLESKPNQRSARMARTFEAETNFVNQKKPPFKKKFTGNPINFSQYKYPRNNNIKSSGKTPGEKGCHGCRHCRSKNHWDFDHVFEKEDRKAKAFLADLDYDSYQAYLDYEESYKEEASNKNDDMPVLETAEEEEDPTDISDDEDFQTSLA